MGSERKNEANLIEVIHFTSPEKRKQLVAITPRDQEIITIIHDGCTETLNDNKTPKELSNVISIVENLNTRISNPTGDKNLENYFEAISATLTNFINNEIKINEETKQPQQ